MKSIRNLCLVGALAAIAACDPYTAENKGQPEILSVFSSNQGEFAAATGNATSGWTLTTTSTCAPAIAPTTTNPDGVPQHVDPNLSAIYVKFNKLLDGASIQATPDSCAPASDWLQVTRNGAPDVPAAGEPPRWYSCYNPSSPTSSEGASVILYRGADVSGGVEGEGWFGVASGAGATTEIVTYALSGSVKDKQGNAIPMNITYTVEPDAGPLGPAKKPVTVDVAAKTITWQSAQCDSGAAATGGYALYKQDPTDDAPVALDTVPAGTLTYTDAGATADRLYFIAPIIDLAGTPYETAQQGPFDTSTNP